MGNVLFGDCLELIRDVPSHSIDAVITDPPYPNVNREYGYFTSVEWFALMKPLVLECQRVLKPTGSAVFILQPNSEKVGKIRPWLWQFMAWACEEWNMIQDVYWYNHTAMPTVHSQAKWGLMKPSIKPMVWLGAEDCYRNQDAILIPESLDNKLKREKGASADRVQYPSGHSVNKQAMYNSAVLRGGVAPFNLLKIANVNSTSSAGSAGHGAGTPYQLCDWWVRYITKPGDVILDPFMGSGTVAQAAIQNGRDYLGFERFPEYMKILEERGLAF